MKHPWVLPPDGLPHLPGPRVPASLAGERRTRAPEKDTRGHMRTRKRHPLPPRPSCPPEGCAVSAASGSEHGGCHALPCAVPPEGGEGTPAGWGQARPEGRGRGGEEEGEPPRDPPQGPADLCVPPSGLQSPHRLQSPSPPSSQPCSPTCPSFGALVPGCVLPAHSPRSPSSGLQPPPHPLSPHSLHLPPLGSSLPPYPLSPRSPPSPSFWAPAPPYPLSPHSPQSPRQQGLQVHAWLAGRGDARQGSPQGLRDTPRSSRRTPPTGRVLRSQCPWSLKPLRPRRPATHPPQAC